jgi:hypothetical protein
MTLLPLAADQRALLHQLIEGDASAPEALEALPLPALEQMAGALRDAHLQVVQAHNARRERIVRVAQSRKEKVKR